MNPVTHAQLDWDDQGRPHSRVFDDVYFSDQSGLEETRVQAILLQRWTPSPAERKRIAAVFGVQPDDIVWGHATPIQHLYGSGPG